MDEDRRIRFLVAPMLFLASILWLSWLNDGWVAHVFDAGENRSKSIEIIAGGGVIVFVAGYVIGTLTQVVLRKGFPYLHKLPYFKSKMSGREGAKFREAGLTEDALDKVWKRLEVPEVPELFPRRDWELWAAAAFDHAVLYNKYNGVHRWLLRRWTAFNIAATSACSFPF
jgi:hypothetical protein